MKSLCLLLAMISAVPVFAQNSAGPTFYVNTGLAVPSAPNEFSDYWKTGINLGGGVGFPITRNLSFVGNLLHTRFSFDGEKLMADNGMGGYGFYFEGGTTSITTFFGDFKMELGSNPGKVTPFLMGGAGLFFVTIRETTMQYQNQFETIPGGDETKLGIDLGGGVDIALSPRTKLQLGMKYIVGFTDIENTSYFPIMIGLSFR